MNCTNFTKSNIPIYKKTALKIYSKICNNETFLTVHVLQHSSMFNKIIVTHILIMWGSLLDFSNKLIVRPAHLVKIYCSIQGICRFLHTSPFTKAQPLTLFETVSFSSVYFAMSCQPCGLNCFQSKRGKGALSSGA